MATRRKFGRSQIVASDAYHDFSCSPCSEDGKDTEAFYHCSICQAFYSICQRCVNFYKKFTRNHSVTDNTLATQSSNNLPTDVCEEHDGEVMKMFCRHHDHVCCTFDIAVKHRSCRGVEYIPNIARGLLMRQGQERTKRSLNKVKADLKDLKSKTKDDLKYLDKQRDSVIDDLEDFKRRIIARVNELERKSLKEIRSKYKELADNLKTYNKKIDELLKAIDTRLYKLTNSKDDNEAQTFVNVKNAEKELSEGNDLVKQSPLRDAKPMTFKIKTDIEEYLSTEESLGSLKEYGSVNIVCPVETRITSAFISELQSQMQSYDIQLECVKASETVAGRYTIVLCEFGFEREALTRTTGIQDNTIILMKLCNERQTYALFHSKRNVKANFWIDYAERRDDKSISFAFERNKTRYESVSELAKMNYKTPGDTCCKRSSTNCTTYKKKSIA
ncbi:uncharacterized protein LOC123541240 [Mercenaria mercenaria]|uniref:uncharacterized protein LOC123541240 n=1 Tax=Mercenaria mercenaria TaxID=6596 RepID=UPI00234F96E8|nr:uncharacterized protein LOC123541240 [Mercenaria mercenaria]